MPFWAGIALDTLDQRADSVAAVLHGIIFGRVAPSSRQRRQITAPALIVGHPADPIHPFADSAMLAEELANAEFVRATSVLEWRARPERLNAHGGGVRPALLADPAAQTPYRVLGRSGPARQNGRVPLYRDEAIVLRTHKLGEADRIITLLTRQHGRVRAVAKGVRKTTSRWGSRLEPFTHVDLQLAEGRNLDVITQADTIDAVPGPPRRPLRPLHRRHRDARDRRPAGDRGEAAVAAAVPAAGRRPAGDDRRGSGRRPRCSTPTSCARSRSPATPRRSPTAPAAATPGRTVVLPGRPVARCARTAGCPAPPPRPPARSR